MTKFSIKIISTCVNGAPQIAKIAPALSSALALLLCILGRQPGEHVDIVDALVNHQGEVGVVLLTGELRMIITMLRMDMMKNAGASDTQLYTTLSPG